MSDEHTIEANIEHHNYLKIILSHILLPMSIPLIFFFTTQNTFKFIPFYKIKMFFFPCIQMQRIVQPNRFVTLNKFIILDWMFIAFSQPRKSNKIMLRLLCFFGELVLSKHLIHRIQTNLYASAPLLSGRKDIKSRGIK